ncbi:MAG: crotonase/enoyl-CoA hydratase family protein [Pseudomonadota bacterium]
MLKKTHACFDVDIEDKIAHITLNRGDALNTMTRDFWNELPVIVDEIDRDALARVIVISSTGKHFSAGMDLSVFAQDGAVTAEGGDRYVEAERFRSNVKYIQGSFNALENARMPVLCAIQGGVIGGAVDMVSAADIRWSTADAFFCIQEINIAMTADVGTFPRLQRLIPEGWVRELAYTGRRLPAAKAREIGLVNEVFDSHEAMMDHVMEAAREIATKDPLAVTGSKAMINYGRDHSTADTLDYVGLWNAGMLPAERMKEAFAAMAEKRPPEFSDLRPTRRTPM